MPAPSRRLYSWNAYESTLTGPINDTTTTIQVTSTAGLSPDTYLVIDPDDPAKREYIYVTDIPVAGTLTIVRNQEGSAAGAQAHDAKPVRAVAVHQWLTNIFEDIGDVYDDIDDHINTVVDPHPIYLTEAEADGIYLRLTPQTQLGGDLDLGANRIVDLADGVNPQDATTKAQMEAADAATLASAQSYADTGDSDHVAAGDPHPQYLTSAEGDGAYVLKAGDTMTGALDMNGEFLTNPLPPVNDTQVGDRGYNDNRYVLQSDGPFLPLAGGTMTGALNMGGNLIDNVNEVRGVDGNDSDPVYTFGNEETMGLYRAAPGRLGVAGVANILQVNGGIEAGANIKANAQLQIGPVAGAAVGAIQFATNQLQLTNLNTGKTLVIGSGAIAPDDDRLTDLGSSSLEWDTIWGVDLRIDTINGIPIANYLNP